MPTYHPIPRVGQLLFSYFIPNNPSPETDPELLVWSVRNVDSNPSGSHWRVTCARTLADDTLEQMTFTEIAFGKLIFFTPTNANIAKEHEIYTLSQSHLINYRIHKALVNKLRYMSLAAADMTRELNL